MKIKNSGDIINLLLKDCMILSFKSFTIESYVTEINTIIFSALLKVKSK